MSNACLIRQREMPSLHGEPLEITQTVSLIRERVILHYITKIVFFQMCRTNIILMEDFKVD